MHDTEGLAELLAGLRASEPEPVLDETAWNARMYEARRDVTRLVCAHAPAWAAAVAAAPSPLDVHATGALARHRDGVVDPTGTVGTPDDGAFASAFPPSFPVDAPVLVRDALDAGVDVLRASDRTPESLETAVRSEEISVREVVQANIGLSVSLAGLYRSPSMSRGDLAQEGNLGLVQAARRFDATRGQKFSTYASYWIRQAMARARRANDGQIVVPDAVRNLADRVAGVRERYHKMEGRLPDDTEVARAMGVTVGAIREADGAVPDEVGLDACAGLGDGTTIAEVVPSEAASAHDVIENDEIGRTTLDALATLDERSRWVLVHRFGIRDAPVRTLDDLGAELGMSREGVRKIEGRALRELRAAAYAGPLSGWADVFGRIPDGE